MMVACGLCVWVCVRDGCCLSVALRALCVWCVVRKRVESRGVVVVVACCKPWGVLLLLLLLLYVS